MNKKKAKILVVGKQFETQETELLANPRLSSPTLRKTTSLPVTTTW